MARVAFRSLALVSTLTLGACMVSEVDPKPQTEYDKSTNFSAYQTFGWQMPQPFSNSSGQPVEQSTQQELMDETARQLEKKGLKEIASGDGTADLLVSISVGTQSGAVNDNFQSWGESFGVGYEVDVSDLRDITTAGLSIEMVSGKDGKHVWTGWATTPLTQEVYADRTEVVKAMVDAVLKEYPPGG
jgi:hypothetical protein